MRTMKQHFISMVSWLALSTCMAQAAVVTGKVADVNGTPVVGVVVTDGYQFTETDNQGIYRLDSDLEKSRFVYLSVPSAYEITTTQGIPNQFYQQLDKGKEVNEHHFTLTRRQQSADSFVYLAISDPQTINEDQMKRFSKETVPDLRETAEQAAGKPVYAMALGDISWDRMDLFEAYKQAVSEVGIPMFSVIGNHDHDLRYPALSNQAEREESYAEHIYEHHFGPYNYSFNVGKVHIVTLKDIDYYKEKKYDERFGKEQLEWLQKDLSYVKPGSLVFINVHAPLFNTTDGGRGNADDADRLREIVAPYQVHIFAGHTHFYENTPVAPNLYEHNIGAACGAWWAGHVNRCGAPNGYLVVEVNSDQVSWYYKATGRDRDYQFRVYEPGTFLSQSGYLVANVWDWDPSYQVTWSEDGTDKGVMEQFQDEDQDFITMKGKPAGYQTRHLFRCNPSSDAKLIQVKVKNRFGKEFVQEVRLDQ